MDRGAKIANAVILGVTSTLGKEIAEDLISENFNVIGSTRKDINIIKKVDNKDLIKTKINYHNLDLSNKLSIDRFIDGLKKYREINLFISTIANSLVFNKFEQIEQSVFEDDLKINVLNHIYLIKKLIPMMGKKSCIIFILTSMVVDTPGYYSSYVVSKYALLGLMKSLSQELKSKGIRVNSVSPGMMDTKFIVGLPKIVKENYKNKSDFIDPKKVAEQIIKIYNNLETNGENILVN